MYYVMCVRGPRGTPHSNTGKKASVCNRLSDGTGKNISASLSHSQNLDQKCKILKMHEHVNFNILCFKQY